ncbi:uncharacterized protein LOC124634355 [Helicoverpa zea]|uniref:uncharacterized protein LOC124634355 n=1 Tax=Helicoverpa zea TaxID=7113 RepID=UPI001F5ACCB0|nr:uncharacterized protein LOC124634355 [Helicoverpa zea]
MSGYPYGNPQQYPPPQGQQIYPQIYNPVNAGAPPPGQPGFQQYAPQYQPSFGYPYQQGQPGQPGQPPSAMSYPNVSQIAPSAPQGPGFGYGPNPGFPQGYGSPIEWIPTTPSDAHGLSNRAVVGGYEGHDGSPLWVIRARFEGDLIPGKLAIKHNSAYVAWGGNENAVRSIEVMCAAPDRVRWMDCHDGNIPQNAIVAGNTSSGEPLYVGRAKEQGSLTPGKVHPSHKVLYISFAGKEVPHKYYEILCSV